MVAPSDIKREENFQTAISRLHPPLDQNRFPPDLLRCHTQGTYHLKIRKIEENREKIVRADEKS